ncbi:MAG: polysaccharide pyruvyl transferase family protein [Rhodocyclaceae bacterium]|nr:polysaccharide pyruvyl transferase family protein [Rhodocyclaceae bacterium]
MKILIYGTISRPCALAGEIDVGGWKTRLKAFADRMLWHIGSTARLDYRNYDAPCPTNAGDIAISEAVRNQLRALLSAPTFINVNWGEMESLDRRVLNACDLIVIAGSGYFSLTKDGLASRIAHDLTVIEQGATPVILYGVGINEPLYTTPSRGAASILPNDEALLKRFLARMSHIGVRDRASQEILARHTDQPVALVGDPALFLDLPGRRVTANPSLADAPPRISINFSFHGPLSTQILKRNLPAYVDLLHTLQEETACTLHYFVHNHSEWIIPVLLNDSGLSVETVCGTPSYLAERYAGMNAHLGGMLHSCILAVGAGTPCVLLPYDIKHRGFAELVGLEAHCHNATRLDPTAVLDSLRYLLTHEEAMRESIRVRLDVLHREQEGFLRACVAAP